MVARFPSYSVTRAVSCAFSIALASTTGCAPGAASHVTIDRGFPTKEQVKAMANAAPPPGQQGEKKGLAVDAWELAGPFPERVGSVPWTGGDAVTRAFAARLEERDVRHVLTESMQCYAREIGRFLARYGQLPEDDLQAYAAGHCGVIPVAPAFAYSTGSDEHTSDAAARWLDQSTAKLPPYSELGVWTGSEAGRYVVLATFGVPKAAVASIERASGGTSAIRVRGMLLDFAAWLRAYSTDGPLGYHACASTPGARVVLPQFDLTCPIPLGDAHAVIDVLTAAPNAFLGRQTLMVLVPTERNRRTPRFEADRRMPSRGSAVEQINALRARLGRAPLREALGQSRIAERLLARYVAAAAAENVADIDRVTLAMMAGWEVPGPLCDAQFLSFRGPTGARGPSFLGKLFFFPSNRAVVLDPRSSLIALGVLEDGENDDVRGLLTTYTTFERRAYPEVEQELVDELDRQRAARGKRPVLRSDAAVLDAVLAPIVERLGRGEIDPEQGLEQVLRTLGRRLQRPLDGRVAYAVAAAGWRPAYDAALVEQEQLTVKAWVGFYAAPGEHWGQFVSYLIYGPTFDARQPSTIPKRVMAR